MAKELTTKEELLKHLEYLKELVDNDYIIGMSTFVLGENDRVIANNVGEPIPSHGILLMEDVINEMKNDFMESPVKPYRRLRALGPEGGYIVVDDDGEPVDERETETIDDDDDEDEESEDESEGEDEEW